ncbi:MAG TPA: hypothetical protein VE907_00660 [Gammaproteobacteria bacterium]|nr:hypothetical protein [Gammaproteobacteria bacterium]
MSHTQLPRSTRAVAAAAVGAMAALLTGAPAAADVVQGTVKPATAKVAIKNAAGEQVAEVSGGAFQLRLPAGKFTAECPAPSQKKVTFFSLAQPTSVNIDCS